MTTRPLTDYQITWAPQPGPQEALINCPHPEVMFGGARGGGKSDAVLGKFGIKAAQYGQHFNGIIFRRELPGADDLIERAKAIYLPLGATWKVIDREFRMPGGGRIRFRPLYNVDDAAKYQGQSLTDVAVEEAGGYPQPDAIDRIFACLRSTSGVPVQMILTSNPGGAGQGWLKSRYV